jgi:hypothetical protein
MGLKPTEVAEGYERALEKALEVLETLSCMEVTNTKDHTAVEKALRYVPTYYILYSDHKYFSVEIFFLSSEMVFFLNRKT